MRRVGRKARGAVLRATARRRRTALGRFVGRAGWALWAAYENDSADTATNGEAAVLSALKDRGLTCAFDVGSFRGDWTADLLRNFPAARAHCFEIALPNQEHLAARFAGDSRVVLNRCGLAAASGELPVYVNPVHRSRSDVIARLTR